MTTRYKIKRGDTLSQIAQRHGVSNWRTIWDHPDNRTVYNRRSGNERMIQPGDELVIPGNASARTRSPAPASPPSTRERRVRVTWNGTTYEFTAQEFAELQQQLVSEIRQGPARQIRQYVVEARSLYDHFKELNSEQRIVSTLIHLTRRVRLPDEIIIRAAEIEADRLAQAVDSGDLRRIKDQIIHAEVAVNSAVERMRDYKEQVIGSAGRWLTGLRITRSTSFSILAVCAAPVAAGAGAGAAGGAAIAGGGAAMLRTVADETGNFVAGTENQTFWTASGNVVMEGLVGATVGLVTNRLNSEAGKAFLGHIGRRVSQRLLSNSLRRFISSERLIIKIISKYLKNAGHSALVNAVQEAGKVVTGATPRDEFLDNVIRNAAIGGFLSEVDDALEKKLAPAMVNRISAEKVNRFFGDMPRNGIEKLVKKVISGRYTSAVESSVERAIDSWRGTTADDLIVRTAEDMAVARDIDRILQEASQQAVVQRT